MKRFLKCLHSEFLKLYYLKATKIVVGLAVFLQAALAYIGAKQILAIGLNATPETNQALLETLPPLEYLGFESILIGIMPMVVLGAIYGAGEYQSHSMRTTLLSVNKKGYVFSAKTIVLAVASAIIATLAIASTILVTHFALGQAGLNPFVLTPLVRKYIVLGVCAWTGLTMVAFMLSFLFRTPIIALLFLIPQIYNVGDFLAKRFTWASFLPVVIGNRLIATSEKIINTNPLQNIGLLIIWIAVIGSLAYVRFYRSDLGGEY